jgi:molybdopterin-guanine dinucleotide biosynthesis protein A
MSTVSRPTAFPPRHCTGVLLAGGASTRFGGLPKGFAIVDGRRVVDRLLDALRPVNDELLLITNDPAVRDALPEIVARPDLRAERSSLVGLHSALTYCRHGALVVAWDMPFVPTALLARLRELGETTSTPALPAPPDGPEPLCAYYPRSALTVVEQQLERGEMRLAAFVDALPHKVLLSPREIASFGAPARLFANINSAADLLAVQQLEGSGENALDSLGTSAEHG